MRAAVFFERDGVLVQSKNGNGAPARFEDFRVCDEVSAPLATLRDAGFLLFATTNQPGVSSGEGPTRRELDLMHALLVQKLGLKEVLVCPHAPDDRCPCRKPMPGLLQEAARRYGIDLDHSFVVSDKWMDADMAGAAGATSVLIRSKLNGSGHHDYVTSDLPEASAKILAIAAELGTLRRMGPQAPQGGTHSGH